MAIIKDATNPKKLTIEQPPIQDQPKIGDLLIKEGFVTKADIERALAIQKSEEEIRNLPLGKILVKMNVLTEDDLTTALNHPNLRKNIGSLAVEKGLITKEDLEFVLANKKPGQLIGELLVEYGLLTRDDIGNLLREQINSPKLGEVLLDLKLITEHDLQEALRRQRTVRSLGEILVDLNIVSPFDLNYVLEKHNKLLGLLDVIKRMGYLNDEQIKEVQREQVATGDPLQKVLLKKKYLTPEQIQTAQARRYNLPFLPLQEFTYSKGDKTLLTNLINQKYAEKNLVLPLSLVERKLTIAIFKPEQLHLVGELKNLFPHLTIECAFITEEKFEELFEILYSKRLSADTTEEQPVEAAQDVDFMEIDLDENLDDASEKTPAYSAQDIEAEEIVNFLIKYGILNNASDIHIEQDRQGPKIRYRIDGILQDLNIEWLKRKLPEKVGAIISRIKVMSNLDIAEKRLPQDGVFRINYYDKAKNQKFDLDFRVATCRAIVGENVVIRILDSRKANVGLENLNHSPHVLVPLQRLLKSSAGMILVSGPTGSGKSSTLYGALMYVYNPGVKIITAEDPIEYSFPGIMQTQIQPKIGITFPRLLRSFLRCDPDVILVGEIRDEETAEIAFDAAQTGHLLLSTIHTNDAVSAVARLADLGIDHSQIASCLLGILAQRLVRRICPFCKQEYVPGEDEWRVLFDAYPSHLTFYRGKGCTSCNFSGYKGRTLISELFVVDKEIGAALSRGTSVDTLKKIALEAGMKSMLEDGLMKLQDTTLAEILRVVPHEMIKTFRARKQVQEDVNSLIDTLFDGTGSKARSVLAPQQFVLSDPVRQEDIIQNMFSKYAAIMKSLHVSGNEPDPALFRKFISEHFRSITRQYGCQRVSFTIQGKNGKAEISALADVR
ncbi:MAG: ATPase, T2SS/T4P/T4SS family [Desulfobacterota bacterium]|nr:ATPase, T2SS/T4P/T4SS family [Thermodesulfobacteriota bacterium]